MKFFVRSLALSLALFVSSAWAIPEADYEAVYRAEVVPFVDSGERVSFKTFDGKELPGVKFIHPDPRGAIVVLPGRSEPWLKYGEVFYDLYQQGYSVYSYDHRGQGLAPRFGVRNPEIGHIDRFEKYTRDLNSFLSRVVRPSLRSGEKLYLLAHSMGGAIAADYLASFESPFAAVVLSSPMLEINTRPYSERVAYEIVKIAVKLGLGSRFAPGKHGYDEDWAFEENDVTSSPERFRMTSDVYAANPETKVGGPSSRWVYESLRATKNRIVPRMNRISTPILMFQATKDRIVKPGRQNRGCSLAPRCTLVKIEGAEHEILMERDSMRAAAFARILEFFSQNR